MHGCQDCQERLLEYLYDLLDEAEQQELRTHLAGCPVCQAAVEKARAQQKLLAAAARMEFPAAQFTPPAAEPPPAPAAEPALAAVRPVLLPVRPRLRKPVAWKRWALAAGVLLAVAGLGIPAGLARRDYSAAERVVQHKQEMAADARKELEEARQELLVAARQRDQRIDEVRHDVRAREMRMEVQGPHSVQAGVPANYQVRTFDRNGKPAAAEIVARLSESGRRGAQAADQPEQALQVREVSTGVYRVSIPPTLRLDPGRPLGMVVEARRKVGPADKRQLTLQGTMRLTAPVYLTHLTTDKPMYQPGELVRFRSLTVDRTTLAPASEEFRFVYTLTDPLGAIRGSVRGRNALVQADSKTGQEITGPDGKPIRGVGAGEMLLEGDAAGGEWTLMVAEERGRFPPATRKFLVNRYQKPRLDKKLDFNRSSYGPGDEVVARVRAVRAGGAGPVKERPVQVTVNVDDQLVGPDGTITGKPFAGKTDGDGVVQVKFRLPAKIERGQASLTVRFDAGDVVEPIVRPIPVVLKKLKLEFFPEGGDLVVGLPNRVYFQARTPLGKPAQVSASLVEDGQVLPGKIETLSDDHLPGVNQGNGMFTFTPRRGRKYELRIDSPSGISPVALPAAVEDGVVLSVPGGVFEAGEPIRAQVRSTRPRTLLVGAWCRGRLLGIARLEKEQTEAVIRPESGAGGVCRITVFEEMPTGRMQRDLRPVAERLVYRQPRERVDVAIAADRRSYIPGQKANVSLFVTDEKEKLTPAILMVAVVDKSVVTMADLKTDRAMPTHLLLTTEVRRAEDLEYADFLVGQHPRAAQALDLLLGTQGWRRFAEQAPEKFLERLERQGELLADAERLRQQEEASRLLVLSGQSSPRTTDPDQDKIDRALALFADRKARLEARGEKARAALEQAGDDPEYQAAKARLGWYRDLALRGRAVLLPVLAVGVVLVLLLAAARALARQVNRLWLPAGLAAALGAVLLVVWQGAVVPGLPGSLTGGPGDVAQRLEVPEPAHRHAWDGDEEEMRLRDAGAAMKPEAGFPGGGGLGAPPPAPAAAVPPAAPGAVRGDFKAPAPPRMPARATAAEAKRDAPVGLAAPGKGGRQDKKGFYLREEREAKADALFRDIGKDRPGSVFDGKDGKARKMRAPGVEQKDLARRFGGRGKAKEMGWAMLPPLVVREYAHHHPTTVASAPRSDFAETVFWHPVLVLPDGKGQISFDLSDSVTSFEVTACAHTLDGRLGAATKLLPSRLPFTLAPKLPVEVTATDRIDVPLAIANNTAESQAVTVRLARHSGLNYLGKVSEQKLELPGNGQARRLFSFRPSVVEGEAVVHFEGSCPPFGDKVEEKLRVVPDGFPVAASSSDLLEKSVTHRLRLPESWVPGTLAVRVDVYPSTLADLQKGLEGLLREPCGCFEQSSTANYPNVLILDYLRTSDQADPQTERRARDLLERGYKKLTSFECREPASNRQRGYEWFGGTAPPHEALTAYGLLQFRDMARVQDVDRAMLQRTRDYLLEQRDGKGGFRRNPRALDTFGRAPQHITDAYIVWALTEGGKDEDLGSEMGALVERARQSEDPYFLSLVALSLANRGQGGEAEKLVRGVAKKQKADGRLEAAQTSITGSGGRDLAIETTALALLAMLRTNAAGFDAPIRAAVKWIGQQRGAYGSFGSTQATILALKGLIAHAKANKRVPEAGEVRLFAGETKLAELSFPAGVDKPLTLVLDNPEKHLKPGENRLRVEITGKKNVFPHTLAWTYRTIQPISAGKVPVTLAASLAKRDLEEGEAVRLKVKVKNSSGAGQGMAVAIVGLPAGLSLPEDLKQLKEHCRLPEDGKRPLVSAFEVRGREVVLYWRDLAKDQEIEVPLDLTARVPGVYRGPASRAYLYYNADTKHWIEPLAVTIKGKS